MGDNLGPSGLSGGTISCFAADDSLAIGRPPRDPPVLTRLGEVQLVFLGRDVPWRRFLAGDPVLRHLRILDTLSSYLLRPSASLALLQCIAAHGQMSCRGTGRSGCGNMRQARRNDSEPWPRRPSAEVGRTGPRAAIDHSARALALAPLIQAMRDAARPTVIQRQVIFDAGFGDTLAAADRLNLSRAASIAEIEAILQQMMARDQDKLTYEIGVVRADNGDFHLYKGKASTPSTPAQAPIPKDIFDGNANAVVTHNHPGGDPLSRGDVLLAVGRNAQEVRAVGGLGVYAFKRRTPGWGPVDNMAVFSAYSEGGAALWRATCPENDKQLRYRLAVIEQVGGNMPNQTFENDFTLEKHFACKMLAQQFPAVVEYSHPDEAQIIADRKALYEQRNPDARDKRAGLGHNQDLAGQGT